MAYLYRVFYCFLKVLCVGVEINWFPRILDISMKLYLSILVKFNLSLVFCQLTWFTTSSQKSSLFSQLHKDHQTKQSSCILFPLFAEVSQTCLIQMCCPSFFCEAQSQTSAPNSPRFSILGNRWIEPARPRIKRSFSFQFQTMTWTSDIF